MRGGALVTGASGFVGRHLLRALAADGTPVTALCRRPEALADLAGGPVAVEAVDLRDAGAVTRLLAGVDTVFHLAAIRNGAGAPAKELHEVNERLTIDLARRAAEAGVRRFVHASTALVFGPSALPLDEGAPLVVDDAAAGPYVGSKARAVETLRALRRDGAPVAIVHPAIVYGPDHPSHPNRVTARIRTMLRRRREIVLGGGRVERDLVHVDDVVAALRAMADRATERQEVVAAAGPLSHRALAGLVARASRRPAPLLLSLPVPVAQLAARVADLLHRRDSRTGTARAVWTLARPWRFSPDGLRELLGREPLSADVGVARTVEWIERIDPFRA